MKRHTFTGCIAVAVALVACGGGSNKPAETAKPVDTAGPATDKDAAASPNTTTPPAETVASSSSAEVTKAIQSIKVGDWTSARSLLEAAIKKNPKQADAYYYLGLVMDKTGDKAAAEKNYKEAIGLQPDLQEAAENLTAIYIENKKFEEAIGIAKKALEKNSKNAEMQLNLAVAMAGKGGDQEGARKAFDDALKLAPNDARFYLTYAQQLQAWKKNDEAIAKLKQAGHVAHDDPGILATIAFELKGVREFKDCVDVLDRAIAAKDVAEVRVYRGQCKLGLKDKEGALADFQAAVAKEPNSAPSHYHLGGALADSGKLKEAIAEWEQTLKLAPTGPLAKASQAKIQKAKEMLAKGGGAKK